MRELFSCIYMARFDDFYRAFTTHNPGIDAALLSEYHTDGSIEVLSPFLPVGISDLILRSVFTPEEVGGCKLLTGKAFKIPGVLELFRQPADYGVLVDRKRRQVSGLLRKAAPLLKRDFIWPERRVYPLGSNTGGVCLKRTFRTSSSDLAQLTTDVASALEGRILFLEELEQSLKENRADWGSEDCKLGQEGNGFSLLDVLQYLAFKGHLSILPSLGFTAPGLIRCSRCGWETVLRDGAGVPFRCEQCSQLGESRLGRPLFAMEPYQESGSKTEGQHEPWGVPPLTPAQSRASGQLKELISKKSAMECLLWAVAGAGKTEVVLGAVAETVNRGGRVLYATPRRDVVMEIAPRLEKSFPDLVVRSVYGGCELKYSAAHLVIATTHQVMRYFRAFELVILDEVDAYPYRENKMLENGVARAAALQGKIIYLTATPGPELLDRARRGKIDLITIPARHHGHPVPEPVFLSHQAFIEKRNGQIQPEPRVVKLLMKWLEAGSQVFVFLPTVRMVELYGSILRAALTDALSCPDGAISCSHSRDPDRDSKRDDFKRGLTRVFVTTSIMERGITVQKANVMVLEADYEQIFDEGSLIQMAGRAGRSTLYPDGQVVFVSRHITGAMKGAKNKIRYMNEQARKSGFLKPGM